MTVEVQAKCPARRFAGGFGMVAAKFRDVDRVYLQSGTLYVVEADGTEHSFAFDDMVTFDISTPEERARLERNRKLMMEGAFG